MSRPLPEEARRAEAVCMACRILRSNQVRLLPADPVSLAREMGFDLMPLRELSSLSREDPDALVRLTRGSDAFTFFFTRTLRVVIVYDDQVRSAERIRFSLFHEFGHILLNHFEFGDLTRMSDAQSRVLEREADIFARNLFCPPPVFDQIRGNPANPGADGGGGPAVCEPGAGGGAARAVSRLSFRPPLRGLRRRIHG